MQIAFFMQGFGVRVHLRQSFLMENWIYSLHAIKIHCVKTIIDNYEKPFTFKKQSCPVYIKQIVCDVNNALCWFKHS